MQSLFFKLESYEWGPSIHVSVLMLLLGAGLVGCFWWNHAPLAAIVTHTAYCIIYKRYKMQWNKREEIIDTLLGDFNYPEADEGIGRKK